MQIRTSRKMSGLAEKNVRTSRKMSGLALFKSASPMDYQSIKSAVHPATASPLFQYDRPTQRSKLWRYILWIISQNFNWQWQSEYFWSLLWCLWLRNWQEALFPNMLTMKYELRYKHCCHYFICDSLSLLIKLVIYRFIKKKVAGNAIVILCGHSTAGLYLLKWI